MKRSILLLLSLVMLLGTTPLTYAAGAGVETAATVSLRIEGKSEALYQNSALAVTTAGDAASGSPVTLRDVIDSYNRLAGVPKAVVIKDINGERVDSVGSLAAQPGTTQYTWLLRINGKNVTGLSDTQIHTGDDIVLYYASLSDFLYPHIDLKRMVSDGIVRFYSIGYTFSDGSTTPDIELKKHDLPHLNGKITEFPITGAAVVWDGMAYTTDDKGEILIDSTGGGVAHTVSIEKNNGNGMPLLLRYPSGYTVKYGYLDVSPSAWYTEDVLFMSERGLLKGVSATEFDPEAPMNRAMIVTLLGRLKGVSVDQAVHTGFTDVISDGWSAGYIDWANKNSIAGGYGNGTFGQYDAITREQLAVMLYKYSVRMDIVSSSGDNGKNEAALTPYADAAGVSAWATPAMKWAVGEGLIQGYNGNLDPQSPATRAEVSAMLRRFMTAHNII